MGDFVDYSLLKTLDTSKIKNKDQFVEYVLHIGNEKFSILVEESTSIEFEEKFQENDIKSYEQFIDIFGNTIVQKSI